ncbi:MAG: hypothetical protein LBK75_04210 [Oscillospiraceae bacterium]|jgi:hypothetical protein|nr:hypothetical protein [Oscillospiraceae bacterium]
MYEDRQHRVSGLLGGWRGRLVRGSALLAAALCLYHLSALAALSTSVTISNNIIRAGTYDAHLFWQPLEGGEEWAPLTFGSEDGQISGQISVTFVEIEESAGSAGQSAMPIPPPAQAPMQDSEEAPDPQDGPETELAPESDTAQGSPEDSQDTQDTPASRDDEAAKEKETAENETGADPNEAPPVRFGPQTLDYKVVFFVRIKNGEGANVPFRYSLRFGEGLPGGIEIASVEAQGDTPVASCPADDAYLIQDQDIAARAEHIYKVTLQGTGAGTINLPLVLEHSFQEKSGWVGGA